MNTLVKNAGQLVLWNLSLCVGLNADDHDGNNEEHSMQMHRSVEWKSMLPGLNEQLYICIHVHLIKLAGVALADQKKRYGEDNWDLFMGQIKAMKARERERKRSRRDMVEDIETDLTRIRGGDEGVIENVTRAARRLWDNCYAAKRSRAGEGIDESREAPNLDWRMYSDISCRKLQ